MQHHQQVQQGLSQQAFPLLACLVNEPKTVTAWHEAVAQGTEQVIEPGTFWRLVTGLERRGWIEALRTEQRLRLYQITALGLQAFERAETYRQGEKLQEGGHPDFRKGREIIMRLVLWMLCLYPPAWRERYEAEMVALLEQHEISFWTVLDLLIGALDARLDPHYRGLRPLLPRTELQLSWRVMGCTSLAFCLAFFLSFSGSWDLGISPKNPVQTCSSDAHPALCLLRVEVGALSNTIESILSPLSLLLCLVLLAMVAVWVLSQMRRKPVLSLLRLLALAGLIPLQQAVYNYDRPLPWWALVLAIACVPVAVESGGALLASSWKTFYHGDEEQTTAHRGKFMSELIGLVFALSVVGSMVLLCIAKGVDLVALWNLFPQLNQYYPDMQIVQLVTFVGMVLATLMALVAFARGTWALRAVYAPPPKSEPLQQAHKQG